MGVEFTVTPRLVEQTLRACGLEASPLLVQAVIHYVEILQKWNLKINLTGLRDTSEILRTHFAESFFAARRLGAADTPVLDIGSGAGFPGLALKLYRPELTVYLLEPRKKRASFLSVVRGELALPQVTIFNKTLEECRLEDFPIRPAMLTLRALGEMGRLTRLGLRLLPEQGKVLLFSTSRQVRQVAVRLSEIDWGAPIPIPWTREKVLLMGQRKRMRPLDGGST